MLANGEAALTTPARTRLFWFGSFQHPSRSLRKHRLHQYLFYELPEAEITFFRTAEFEDPCPPNIRVEVAHYRRRLRFYRFAWNIPWRLLTGRYDLVVTSMLGSFPTFCTVLIGRLLRGKPYIVVTENWYPKGPVKDRWYRRTARSAALIVSQSTKSRKFITSLGVPDSRAVKCLNTLADIGSLPYNQQLESDLNDGSVKVLCVARFVPFKGQRKLIEAFQAVDSPNARLLFVGNHRTPYGAECIAAAGGDSRIEFRGHAAREDVLAYYRACDIYAQANEFVSNQLEGAESFGYAVVEAAQMGLPIIVTTATGCADDVVVEGRTGFQVPADNLTALTSALSNLMHDPVLRSTMGSAGAEHVSALGNEDVLDELRGAIAGLTRYTN